MIATFLISKLQKVFFMEWLMVSLTNEREGTAYLKFSNVFQLFKFIFKFGDSRTLFVSHSHIPAIAFSKFTIEALEQSIKYVQS